MLQQMLLLLLPVYARLAGTQVRHRRLRAERKSPDILISAEGNATVELAFVSEDKASVNTELFPFLFFFLFFTMTTRGFIFC